MSAKAKVLLRCPQAVCISGGRPAFQIWFKLASFAGRKLGEGSTRKFAWEDAERKTRSPLKADFGQLQREYDEREAG